MAELVQSDHIACAHYYDDHMKYFWHLYIKDDKTFNISFDFFGYTFKVIKVNTTRLL